MAGSITLEHYTLGHVRKIVATCVGDASDGSFPDTVLPSIEGRLLWLVTAANPQKSPTDDYDVTVEDQHGYDVLEGVGADRPEEVTVKAPIVFSGSAVHPCVDESDELTLKIANNSVASAEVVVEIYYAVGA